MATTVVAIDTAPPPYLFTTYARLYGILRNFVIKNAIKMASMFGVIVSGQLVQTDFQLVGEKQFLAQIAKQGALNHLVVFLTGAVAFPEGTGGLVYFSLPDAINPPAWHVLGYISNEKPSAIFKVSGLNNAQRHLNADGSFFTFGGGATSITAQIGIAVESLANIQQQCPTAIHTVEAISTPAAVQFAQKMLENLFNFAMSFAVTQAQMTPNPTENFVPLSSLQTWYKNFERKLLASPDFLQNF